MAKEGHAKVAALMSQSGELAIFRRFSKLNLQNLLYLQAEITHLEKGLEDLAERDFANASLPPYHNDWWYLANPHEADPEKEQWMKVLEIRQKLKEYSTAENPPSNLLF